MNLLKKMFPPPPENLDFIELLKKPEWQQNRHEKRWLMQWMHRPSKYRFKSIDEAEGFKSGFSLGIFAVIFALVSLGFFILAEPKYLSTLDEWLLMVPSVFFGFMSYFLFCKFGDCDKKELIAPPPEHK